MPAVLIQYRISVSTLAYISFYNKKNAQGCKSVTHLIHVQNTLKNLKKKKFQVAYNEISLLGDSTITVIRIMQLLSSEKVICWH